MDFPKEKLPKLIHGLGLDDNPIQQELCLLMITNLAAEGLYCLQHFLESLPRFFFMPAKEASAHVTQTN